MSKITQKINSCRGNKEKQERRKNKNSYADFYRRKLIWGASLKPGDMICDCRYKHIQIKSIAPEYGDEIYERVVGDYQIETEDGRYCSLIHCCDPVDHPENDHG